MKKTWTKPKLVVLSRGTPSESVLGWCKVEGFGGPAGAEYYLGCNLKRDLAGECDPFQFCETSVNT